ncbi:MAG: FAD-binding domain-containing protein [Pseudomonadota bacterium]
MTQMSFLKPDETSAAAPVATSDAARARLKAFVPSAGAQYARRRNFDLGPDDRSNVSVLSPWVRRRLILEEDILRVTLATHSLSAAEKFVQEVFWRGYFKGWLEHRPAVWTRYKQNLIALVDRLESDALLERRYAEAVEGRTGIECFDVWARELIATGYLHNHARMWFASIWIFTLELPWELGADFFYRHLLDGDPASNTCSWRWVGGLHTAGKTYLARPDNIKKYTDGRFEPAGQLAREAPALEEPNSPAPAAPVLDDAEAPGPRVGLLITEEDCSPESLMLPATPTAILALASATPVSVLPMSETVQDFSVAAVKDAAARAEAHFGVGCEEHAEEDWAGAIADWADRHKLDGVVAARAGLGPVQKRLRNACKDKPAPLIEIARDYDRSVWPHARAGFFGLKKKIPSILAELGLA